MTLSTLSRWFLQWHDAVSQKVYRKQSKAIESRRNLERFLSLIDQNSAVH